MLVFLFMSQCIFVILSPWTLIARANEPDGMCEKKPMLCVECSTQQNDQYCADPFNATLLRKKLVPLKQCKGFCVKWVKKGKEAGSEQYVRTCSDNIQIQMQINMVCISESRSGNGHLCFCNKDKCNAAQGSPGAPLPFLLLLLLSLSLWHRVTLPP